MHGMHTLGEGPEVNGIRETSRRGAGMVRPVRHHVLPQEHRKWFEERGFVGDMDIDNFTVELEEAMHQAAHGGNWPLGRTWPREWNQLVMDTLKQREKKIRRPLRAAEIIEIVQALMTENYINKPFRPYKGQ